MTNIYLGELSAGRGRDRAFSLVEMLVSLAVLSLILVILFSMLSQTSKVVQTTSGKIETFQAARNAFETMTRTISLATLNSYYDYIYSGTPGTSGYQPTGAYQLTSNLHFVSGDLTTTGLKTAITALATTNNTTATSVANTQAIFFQAPLGYSQNTSYQYLDNLLNACGYFIQYGPDTPPGSNLFSASTTRYRYQLMQYLQPSENLSVYSTSAGTTSTAWFNGTVNGNNNFINSNIRPIADNVIALVIAPENTSDNTNVLTTNYDYDSRMVTPANVLPPVVEITMVAIDEGSALKMGNTTTEPTVIVNALHTPALFTTYSQAQLKTDLQTLESNLSANHITYHVFQTLVAMRSANFSL